MQQMFTWSDVLQQYILFYYFWITQIKQSADILDAT